MIGILTECQKIKYKNAGYDWYVYYQEWKEEFGTYMTAGFPTTCDALRSHIESIKSRDTVQLNLIPL